jgi:hypothetical protein
MSAGSLAKAISKSGSSLPTRYSRPSISSSSIRAQSSHSKILSLFFAVMYGKGVALSDTLAIKSDDLLNNHLATII